jgi:hypothetical protein
MIHPHAHKISSINHLMNRVHTYPVTKEWKKDATITQDIFQNNEYNKDLV